MSEVTGISWTDSSWNPWMGCKKVSAGCRECYMFRDQKRYGRDPSVVVRSKTQFNAPLKWAKEIAASGEKKLVFTCSWSDFFIQDADEWRDEAWGIIRVTPNITYQILTKRPELIKDRLPADWGDGYKNVWLGVSVENQKCADARIPSLLDTPAAVRFLSCEPLLEPLNLTGFGSPTWGKLPASHWLHWVIVGGESGPHARPMDITWARDLKAQCQAAGIAFFMKQLGGKHGKRELLTDMPEDLRIREFPMRRET